MWLRGHRRGSSTVELGCDLSVPHSKTHVLPFAASKQLAHDPWPRGRALSFSEHDCVSSEGVLDLPGVYSSHPSWPSWIPEAERGGLALLSYRWANPWIRKGSDLFKVKQGGDKNKSTFSDFKTSVASAFFFFFFTAPSELLSDS